METKEKNTATPYDLDGKPPLKLAIPLGLQHVLAMFVGNLTPLIVICGACGIGAASDFAEVYVELLQNAMIIAGVVTLVQLLQSVLSVDVFRSLWERVPVLLVYLKALQVLWVAE